MPSKTKNKKSRQGSSNKTTSKRLNVKGAHVVFHRLLNAHRGGSLRAVLLAKRTQDAPNHAGYWGLVGGSLDKGENPKAGALRECHEELMADGSQWTLASLKPLIDVRLSRRKEDGLIGARYFHCELNAGMDQLRLKKNKEEGKVEGEGLAWFTPEEVHHLMMRPEDRLALNAFFAKEGI